MTRRQEQIEHYLRTGECVDLLDGAAGSFAAASHASRLANRQALVAAVHARQGAAAMRPALPDIDVRRLSRRKLGPMIKGLFAAVEQEPILAVLERSLVFLTPASIERILLETPWSSTAWNLANLYLGSIGAALLADDAPALAGLSEGTTCYVTMDYFAQSDRFSDVVVHEAAHVLHNTKRIGVGLPGRRNQEWLLEIAFQMRETFAYCCEAFSRIAELGAGGAQRRTLLAEIERHPPPPDSRVDHAMYCTILRDAVEAKNGWKRILDACAPAPFAGRTRPPVRRIAVINQLANNNLPG